MGVVMIKCPETRDPNRHESGSGKVSVQSGILRAHLLFDLQSQSRMVCQGGLGSRVSRGAADGHTYPATGVESLRPAAIPSMAP
jgi:hypothetical protein